MYVTGWPLHPAAVNGLIRSQIHQNLKRAFATGKSRDIQWRKKQLLQLWHLVEDNISLLYKALHEDLGRAPDESDGCECNHIVTTRPDRALSSCPSIALN